ncbi:hypothetical protein D3C79_986840 [compost metagenome]
MIDKSRNGFDGFGFFLEVLKNTFILGGRASHPLRSGLFCLFKILSIDAQQRFSNVVIESPDQPPAKPMNGGHLSKVILAKTTVYHGYRISGIRDYTD